MKCLISSLPRLFQLNPKPDHLHHLQPGVPARVQEAAVRQEVRCSPQEEPPLRRAPLPMMPAQERRLVRRAGVPGGGGRQAGGGSGGRRLQERHLQVRRPRRGLSEGVEETSPIRNLYVKRVVV